MKGIFNFIFSVLVLLMCVGCETQVEEPVITGFFLEHKRVNINVGDHYVLIPTFFPQGVYDWVDWRSSNPTVASVDDDGYVMAHSMGFTKITATVQGFRDSCIVYVLPHIYVAGQSGVYDGGENLKMEGASIVRATASHKVYTSDVVSIENYNWQVKVNENGARKYTLYSGEWFPELYTMEVDGENLYTAFDYTHLGKNSWVKSSKLFKNNRLINTFESGYGDYSIRSIAVSNGDVYCGGSFFDGRYKAMIWKNGMQLYKLYEGIDNAFVTSVAISGNDIYALVSIYGTSRTFEIYKNGGLLYSYSSNDVLDGNKLDNLYCSNLCVSNGRLFYTLSFKNGFLCCVDGRVLDHIGSTKGIYDWSVKETAIYGDNYYILGFRDNKSAVWMNNDVLYEYALKDGELTSMSLVP